MKKISIIFFGTTIGMFALAIYFGLVMNNLELGVVFTALASISPIILATYFENKLEESREEITN